MKEQSRDAGLELLYALEREPSGVEIGPVALLHRHEDGFIAFMRTDPVTGKVSPFAAVTAAELRAQPFLPTLVEGCGVDGFVSMNAFYRRGREMRKTKNLRYLNAAFVDLDFYQKDATGKIVRVLDWYDAVATMLRLGDEGTIPPPSIYVRSGNGAWLLWLLHDEETGQSPRAWPERCEWLKRIQTAAREGIRAAAAALRPDGNAADLSRVLRVPGSASSKARMRRVSWIPIPDADTGEVISYTLTELGDFFGEPHKAEIPQKNIRLRDTRPSEKRVPRRNAGKRAVSEQRLQDLRLLSALRGGFSEGCRNFALLAVACFMAKLHIPHEQIREELESEAARCKPRLSDEEAEQAFKSATTGRYSWRSTTLVERLNVTEGEAVFLAAEGTPLRQIRPGFVPKGEQKRMRGEDRKREQANRRELIRREVIGALDAIGKVPPLRDLSLWLESRGVSASHETIRKDLVALKLHPSQIPDRQRLILETFAPDGEPN